MQAGMFSGLFAALTTEHRMNFIANNLANVNTRGYKRETLAFKDTMTTFAFDGIREPLQNLKSTPLFPEPMNAARVRVAVRGRCQKTVTQPAANPEKPRFCGSKPDGYR